jgi:hypothetical protein
MKHRRKKMPLDIETKVLFRSARRCTLCFYLKGDLREKRGQIAHLDGDPENNAEVNLAFMCLDHHSVYDSRTSQHKNYSITEIKKARAHLYRAVRKGQHLGSGDKLLSTRLDDRKTLNEMLTILSKSGSIDFLRKQSFDGWSFEWQRLDGIERILDRKGPQYEFLDAKLDKLRKQFVDACQKLLSLLATETFPVGNGSRQAVPEEWEEEQPDRYERVIKHIHAAADFVCNSHDELIRIARNTLSL